MLSKVQIALHLPWAILRYDSWKCCFRGSGSVSTTALISTTCHEPSNSQKPILLSTHLATPPVSIWTHNSFPSVENGHFEICNPHHLMRSKIHTIFSLGYPLFAVRIVGYPLIVVRTKIPTPTMYPATPPISIWTHDYVGALRTGYLKFAIHSGTARGPGMTLIFKSNVWLKREWRKWMKMFDLSGCLT